MLQVLKRLYLKLFKPTQLIVRQDANVKMIVLPSWLQVCLLMIFAAIALWSVNAAIQLHNNNIQLSQGQQNLTQLQAKWQHEKAQLEQTITQQQNTLAQLSQQHNVLESLIDATELAASNSKTDEHSTDKEASPDNDNTFAPQAAKLLLQQQTLNRALGQKYATDIAEIKASIDSVGLQLADSSDAQGGPYFQADLALVEASFINTIDYYTSYAQLSTMIGQLPDTLPVEQEKYYVSSAFGFRKDPITGRRAFHKGIDLAGWHKTDIVAPAAGVVKRAGKNGGYGKFIEIEHANEITTRYGHLHTIKVKKGQQVDKGDVIALMGSTGRSTSTHLHYEVIQGKKHLNPIKIARAFNK
ncbi:M23 family peptidase [Pseudoalteromonas sp. J010]|uniref:M23 family metallopeptidase n=1 Tax=Pseudoalteromonas sp. J010 TaxID=998465 RepID=UPI000F649191|nr:M23 family metallopeptidase [Pseudoalteromonas sp. J010]RRS09454.1 M23 family peptidase [Pseudoalteromonas sp. J010]